jgi:hypothetical protein
MPQYGDRSCQVLHWDEVYGQFAQTAASMPLEEVDRDLAAMGFDLDRLGGTIGRLGRRTGAQVADGTSVACREERADAILRRLSQPAPHAIPNATGAAGHRGGWRRGTRHAVTGVVAVALLAWLAVPISETSVGRHPTASIAKSDKQAHIRIAEASPSGLAQQGEADSGSPHIANPPYPEVATSEKCEAVAYRQANAVEAGDKLAKIAADENLITNDGEGKSAPAAAEEAERPRAIAMARGQQPPSVG